MGRPLKPCAGHRWRSCISFSRVGSGDDDLRCHALGTRRPTRETIADESQAVRLVTSVQRLADYWASNHDWHKAKATLEAHPQLIIKINGLHIHFIDMRFRQANALPVIVIHCWPGPVIEHLEIIGPLTDPTAHGGSGEDDLEVVIPPLPGRGFSGKPRGTDWDPVRVACAWTVLMRRLDYTNYAAESGDWGDAVPDQLAMLAPLELLGIHVDMTPTVSDEVALAGLAADVLYAHGQLHAFHKPGLGYAIDTRNRPQTPDVRGQSHIGLVARMLDHDAAIQFLIVRVLAGKNGGPTHNNIRDSITLHWFTKTAVSSARLCWESKLEFFAVKDHAVPWPSTSSPTRSMRRRSAARRGPIRTIRFNKLDKGRHYYSVGTAEGLLRRALRSFRALRSTQGELT